MSDKTRTLKFFGALDCDASQQIGFTTSNIKDNTIGMNMKDIDRAIAAGQVKHVSSEWTPEQLAEAERVPYGKQPKDPSKPWYHVIPAYYYIVDSVGGRRTGSRGLMIGGDEVKAGIA